MNEEKKIDNSQTANDSNTLLYEVTCPFCDGYGYTSEHVCDGTEIMCAKTCPQQVQCEYCYGTGKMMMPKKERQSILHNELR
jgi:DnaJ-class molecular chaperone